MRSVRSFLALSIACAQAQTTFPPASSENHLSVQTRLVQVTATVRNGQGILLSDLKREDFIVKEDGKPQAVSYFNRDSDLPLRIGLLIDTSGSEREYLNDERRASETFLNSMLTQPEDRAFLVQFDNNILLLQAMTSNLSNLQLALGRLMDSHPVRKNGGGTLLFDAIRATAQRITSAESGRSAIVILTDGDDNGSTTNYEEATELAQLASTTVYTVFYSTYDPGPTQPLSAQHPSTGRAIMEHISNATGGHLFVVSKKLPIETIYAEIEQELRTQYRLGYSPPPSKPFKHHDLEVKTVVPHGVVQAQTGYFTPK